MYRCNKVWTFLLKRRAESFLHASRTEQKSFNPFEQAVTLSLHFPRMYVAIWPEQYIVVHIDVLCNHIRSYNVCHNCIFWMFVSVLNYGEAPAWQKRAFKNLGSVVCPVSNAKSRSMLQCIFSVFLTSDAVQVQSQKLYGMTLTASSRGINRLYI